jgi:type II secretory pathway component GspD/PulD (secretin)
MDISPTISQLSSALVQISKGFSVPIINQRSATTTVSVQSGQSILIGGLIGTTDDANTKRMPFLGKIPVLGALFRNSQKITSRTELLILLTPQVLVKGDEQGTTKNALSVTREHLDRSVIRDQFNSDPLQRQILEPLYPELRTNAPSQKPVKPRSDKKPASRSSNLDVYK